jgi:hypothetical protein
VEGNSGDSFWNLQWKEIVAMKAGNLGHIERRKRSRKSCSLGLLLPNVFFTTNISINFSAATCW